MGFTETSSILVASTEYLLCFQGEELTPPVVVVVPRPRQDVIDLISQQVAGPTIKRLRCISACLEEHGLLVSCELHGTRHRHARRAGPGAHLAMYISLIARQQPFAVIALDAEVG